MEVLSEKRQEAKETREEKEGDAAPIYDAINGA